MEVLELEGVRYVKAAKAAKANGYTTDYVGQLCRSGKISAHLVGRSWYVDESELKDHKVSAKRNARTKAKQQFKKAVKATVEKGAGSNDAVYGTMRYRSRVPKTTPAYETDDSSLIPEVRKLSVSSESFVEETKRPLRSKAKKKTASKKNKADREEINYEVENEGKDIVLSGSIPVVDATDEFMLDPSATLLEAKIEKTTKSKKNTKKSINTAKEKQQNSYTIKAETTDSEESIDVPYNDQEDYLKRSAVKLSFREKLAVYDSPRDEPESSFTEKTNKNNIISFNETFSEYSENENSLAVHSISEGEEYTKEQMPDGVRDEVEAPGSSEISGKKRSFSLVTSLVLTLIALASITSVFVVAEWSYSATEDSSESSAFEATLQFNAEAILSRLFDGL